MKVENLTEQHLIEIVKLYEEHCGFGRDFRDVMYQEPSTVLEHLRKQGREEYRIGSKWDGHSKIYFDTDFEDNIEVKFNSNFDPIDRQGKKFEEAETSGKIFVKTAMQYLSLQ
ncbi:hypothetical protein KAT80_00365 [Candidatus Pacearchaeota archaeon]|nr:hypothetical protein [Candidatus Pacearchaeota archaeon]